MEIKKKTVLIPAMLDFHFPLLQYAFCSKKYDTVILKNEENIINSGLRYTHNDLCYPCQLIIGQMINALKSGKYDTKNSVLLIPQAGDACRGSNYIHAIRKAVIAAGFPEIHVISLNIKGLESENLLNITGRMIRRAVAAIIYGNILMLLKNQIKPYEENSGETQIYVDKWIDYLGLLIKNDHKLSPFSICKICRKIAIDFKNIKCHDKQLQKIGIIGELYTKYCHLGNCNIEKFLSDESCEYMVNGFSWYIIYYIDTHQYDENILMRLLYNLLVKYLTSIQKSMVKSIRNADFKCLDEFNKFKHNAKGSISFVFQVADGWLMGTEIVNLINCGFNKILCIQPFGCLPNHVCGKGMYPHLLREFPNIHISSIDFDSSESEINILNRIKMLIDLN